MKKSKMNLNLTNFLKIIEMILKEQKIYQHMDKIKEKILL